MLAPQVCEKLLGGPGASVSYIFVAVADALHCLCEVLALPLQVGRENIIKRSCSVLSPSFGILFELRLTLRFKWDHIHIR